MATLEEAVAAGLLEAFSLPDWEPRLPSRRLPVAPELFDWADGTPELHDMRLAQGSRTLFEHLLQMFCEFRCCEHVHYSDLKRMMPTSRGVWHMYPVGLRIYGWVPSPHAFIAITAALVQHTKDDRSLNNQKRGEVLAFARRHCLDHTIQMGDFLALFPH
jgi:hypothetical protein